MMLGGTGLAEGTLINYTIQLYAKVFNLLDSGNPNNVYTDTGEAGFTLQETRKKIYASLML